MSSTAILEKVTHINQDLIDMGFDSADINTFWEDCIAAAEMMQIAKENEMPIINLSSLFQKLKTMKEGDYFKIKGEHSGTWELYTETKEYFFIRQTASKQMVLIEKYK